MRKSGIILHISSLPSNYGIGKMGDAAYVFANFWQTAAYRSGRFCPCLPPATATRRISPFPSMPEIRISSILNDWRRPAI